MSKFNNVAVKETEIKQANLAGGIGYKNSAKQEFLNIILNSFCKDEYYSKETYLINHLEKCINENDLNFVAKASIFSRNVFGLRSINHVTASILLKLGKGSSWLRPYLTKLIHRPDDMLEIFSYYTSKNCDTKKVKGQTKLVGIPNAMKRAFRDVLSKLDTYQLTKYQSNSKSVKLVDLVNLFHPKGNENLNAFMQGKLKADTWESEFVRIGQMQISNDEKEQKKLNVFKNLLIENKLGYMALLRNLNNIVNNKFFNKEIEDLLVKALNNEKAIKKSLIYPFRFITAIDNFTFDNRTIKNAVQDALDLSVQNVPKFDGKTLIVVDVSGSMSGNCEKNASLLGSILFKRNDADLMIVGTKARYINLNARDSIYTISKELKTKNEGTNLFKIFEVANKVYDRIILLSDMESWMHNTENVVTGFKSYKNKFNCNPYFYSYNLSSYNDLILPENKVFCLSGFNPEIFTLMQYLEKDRDVIFNEIEKIEL